MTGNVLLIDGSSYVYRAFHALPQLTRKSDGQPTGAVVGFCNMLWRLIEDAMDPSEDVSHMAVIFDKGKVTFRNEIYAAYKGNRSETPDMLKGQFGLIRRAVEAFNLPMIEMQGFEADDLIATYAHQAIKAGFKRVTIVSPDKDMLQLVGDEVFVLHPLDNVVITARGVFDRFGVGPERFADFQALTGDVADNIPGIPGIGDKTAAKLLRDYGDLDTLLLCVDEVKPTRIRWLLQHFAEQARLSRRLAKLSNDVAVEVPLDGLAIRPRDYDRILAFCAEMEFVALPRRIMASMPAQESA